MEKKSPPLWPIIATILIIITALIIFKWERYPSNDEVKAYMQNLYPKSQIEVTNNPKKKNTVDVKVTKPSGFTDSITTPLEKKRVLPWHSYYDESNLAK